MLNELAERQLRKAGWYPGRKADISDQIEFWESCGYQTFDAAVKFMEEFGKLHITDKYIFKPMNSIMKETRTTYVTEILEYYCEWDELDKFVFNLSDRAKEKILPVIKDDIGGSCEFIGESGAFYCGVGLSAENFETLINEHYSSDYGIALPWDKIGTGEQRKRYHRKNIYEYLDS